MNKTQLIASVAKKTRLSQSKVKQIFAGFEDILVETLAKDGKVTITGFGTFVLSKRAGRMGVSPRDPDKKIKIPASVIPHFRPSNALKRKIK